MTDQSDKSLADLVFKDELTEAESERLTDLTLEGYGEYLNPAFLDAKRGADAREIEWRGDGARMYASDGRSFIDCLGGYGVFALGHCPEEITEAVQQVYRRIGLSSQELLNPLQALLGRELAELTPGDLKYTYFHGGGAESNDAAFKVARLATGNHVHVSFSRSFHGKTMGALSATRRESVRAPFEPLVPGFVELPWDDTAAAQEFMAERGDEVASVVVEPMQGEGGINVPSDDFLPALEDLCEKHGALLHLDEVQTGFCRTGKMFAADWWDVEPDLMTFAKSFGGGIAPISAVHGTPEAWEGLEENPYYLTNTFGGSQPLCAGALAAILKYQEMNLADRALDRGEYFLAELEDLKEKYPDIIKEVRGRGLFIGVEMHDEPVGKGLSDLMFQRDVLTANTMNNPSTIRIEPPLIITEEQIDTVVERFDDALHEIETGSPDAIEAERTKHTGSGD